MKTTSAEQRAMLETVRATAWRRAADEMQVAADAKKHWNLFPRTAEARAEATLKREAWQQAEEEARGARRRQNAAATAAAARFLKAAR